MKIRKVNKNDYQNIYELVKIAFQTAQVSDGSEQDFVLKLRAGDTFIPDLEFVAEENNQLIGHIMMTKQDIHTKDGLFTGVLVAPLCVEIQHRNQGIGSALMHYAFQEALQKGYTAAFLVGNPEYYQRFGYHQTTDFDIQNKSEIPDQYVLACEIVPHALSKISGYINIE